MAYLDTNDDSEEFHIPRPYEDISDKLDNIESAIQDVQSGDKSSGLGFIILLQVIIILKLWGII